MLQSFKDRIRGSRWLGYTIVALISIPFALWGIEAYLRGGGQTAVASVNGEEIQSHVVERRVAQRRQALNERFGGSLPDSFSDQMLREQVVGQMIDRKVLQQATEELGLVATSQAVAGNIRGQSAFQREGEFNRDLYRQVLRQSGLSPAQYESRVARSVRVQQLQSAVANSAFVPDSEVEWIARLSNEERDVASLEYPRSAAEAEIELEQEAIESYYEDHGERFRTPEQVKLAYVELDLEALKQQVDVSEQELRQEYEAAGQRYREAAARKASHILIEVPQDASDAAEQEAMERIRTLRRRILEEGAEFEAIAREHSDDPGSAGQGGDLGFITRGTMVEPFEERLFGMQEQGSVSEPVRTRYGYHLIRLDAIREREQKPFAEVRDKIAEDLRTRRARSRFHERVEVLKNSAYENPDSLEAVADATGLAIEETDWISRKRGEGIASNPEVREVAFSDAVLDERRNSDVIELGERRVAVVRATDHRAPQPRPLEAVRDQVAQAVREEKTNQRLDEWSQRVTEQLEQGQDPASLAEAGVRWNEHGWITRSGSELGQRLVRAAFDLSPPPEGERAFRATERADGGRAVVIVRDVRLPDAESQALEQARQRRMRQLSRMEFQALTQALRDAADIERYDRSSGQSNQSR